MGKQSCWQPRPLPLGPVSGWGPPFANQVSRVEVKGLQEGELSEVWGSGEQSPSCKPERGTRGGNGSREGGGSQPWRGHCCPPPGP